jgi:hypothetical protein
LHQKKKKKADFTSINLNGINHKKGWGCIAEYLLVLSVVK